MCEYELDLARIVEETEQTQFGLHMDQQMDGRIGWTERQNETSMPKPPKKLRWRKV